VLALQAGQEIGIREEQERPERKALAERAPIYSAVDVDRVAGGGEAESQETRRRVVAVKERRRRQELAGTAN
jgi:hypothetical protein